MKTAEDFAIETTRRKMRERWERMFPASWRNVDLNHECLKAWKADAARVLGWRPSVNNRGLLLAGPTGRGKTRVCAQLLGDLMENHLVWCSLWKAQKLAAAITERCAFGADVAASFISDRGEDRVLFIDDLGQESVIRSQDERVKSWIFELIDLRCTREKPTIVTTNLTASEMVDGFGELKGDPLLRRLSEMCEVIKVA